jgi:hypothetical protein
MVVVHCKKMALTFQCDISHFNTSIYNQRGIDGLVEFLLQQQTYARNIEQQVKHLGLNFAAVMNVDSVPLLHIAT